MVCLLRHTKVNDTVPNVPHKKQSA